MFSSRAVVSMQVATKVIITCVLGISTTFFIMQPSTTIIYHRKNTNLSLFGKMIYFSNSVSRLHSNRGTNCPPPGFGQSMTIVLSHHPPKLFKTSHPLVYFVLLLLVYFASLLLVYFVLLLLVFDAKDTYLFLFQ